MVNSLCKLIFNMEVYGFLIFWNPISKMKLLGVTGKPGAGKTTFSTLLASHPEVGLIHVDDLVGEAKYKYFGFLLKRNKDKEIEVVSDCGDMKNNPKVKGNIKRFFYKNKLTFAFLTWLRNALIQNPLEQLIKKYEDEGKKAVVIDDWILSKNKKLFKKLSKIYYVDRNYLKRREGLRKRDDLDKEELKTADLPYALHFVTKPTDQRVVTIENKGSLDDLSKKADDEFKKLNLESFRERISEKNHSPQDISQNHTLSTTPVRKNSRNNIRKSEDDRI